MASFAPLLSVRQHDQAQTLRHQYAAQLLALEQNLDPAERCYDAGLIAARLVAAATDLLGSEIVLDSSWLAQFFSPELIAARFRPPTREAPSDELLNWLSMLVGGGGLGQAIGAPLGGDAEVAGPSDLDAALALL